MREKLIENKYKLKKVGVCGILGIELVLLIFLLTRWLAPAVNYSYGVDEMLSDEIIINGLPAMEEAGYYIDSSMEAKEKAVSTPLTELRPGLYEITVYYSASAAQGYSIEGDKVDFQEMTGNFGRKLPENETEFQFVIKTSKQHSDFQIVFHFDGEGYLFISRIEIVQNKARDLFDLLAVFVVVILVNFLLFFRKGEKWKAFWRNEEKKKRLIILAAAVLFSSLPLLCPYLFIGHDLDFHLLRIEGIKDGLRTGHFPVRVQPNWLNGYGYAASIFYGDTMLYFPALLRLLGIGVQSAYKSFVFLTNVLTVWLSWYCFKRITQNERAAWLGCFMYSASVCRLADIYIRASVGEYCALTFLPLILTAVYEILEGSAYREKKNSWILGAIGVSGLIWTHVISCEMAGVFTIVMCLIFWKRTFKKDALLEFLKMGALALGLTCSFVLPFLDMMREGFNFAYEKKIQSHGTYFSELFTIFPGARGVAPAYGTVEGISAANQLSFSIGGGAMIALLLYIWYRTEREESDSKYDKLAKLFFYTSVSLVLMTTVYFPWNWLQRLNGTFDFMIRNMEFPWRLLTLCSLTFSVLACLIYVLSLEENQEKAQKVLICLMAGVVLSSGYFLSDRINDNLTEYIQSSTELDTCNGFAHEYLPKEMDLSVVGDPDVKAEEGMIVELCSRNGQHFAVTCVNDTEKERYIDLPLIYYKGYHIVKASDSQMLRLVSNEYGCVRIVAAAGYKGKFEVDYSGMWYWRISDAVSLLSFVGLVFYLFNLKKNLLKNRKSC